MTSLEQSFAEICARHDLRALGITFHPNHAAAFTVYAHAELSLCAGESRETLAEAIGASLASMAAKRADSASLADEALPVEQAA